MKTLSFTITSSSGINNVLITPVGIFSEGGKNTCQTNAIWDTGATSSVITKTIAKKLGLIPTGMCLVSTANGTVPQNTYTVEIGLPNGLLVKGVVVTEVDGLSGGCEVLIGMDIITLGDFSVTNFEGVTRMSFRIPSIHAIDYTNAINLDSNQKISASKKSGKERGWENKFRNSK